MKSGIAAGGVSNFIIVLVLATSSLHCSDDPGGQESVCGNGTLDPGESCDGDEFGVACTTMGYLGGEIACTDNCEPDVTGCWNERPCGNERVDDGEECDGSNLGDQTCEDLGFGGGSLTCDNFCSFDTRHCRTKDQQEALRWCAFGSACALEGFQIGIGFCYDLEIWFSSSLRENEGSAFKALIPSIDCQRSAEDCDALSACTAASLDQFPQCESQPGKHICSGDVVLECPQSPDMPVVFYDCGAAGLVCGMGEDSAECGTGTCDPSNTPVTCDGNLLVKCNADAMVLVTTDCRFYDTLHCYDMNMTDCSAHHGEVCGIDSYGDIACVGTGLSCSENEFVNRCEGSIMVTCTGGKIARTDCATVYPGTTCRVAENKATRCLPEKTDCSSGMPETCQQGVITFCGMGEIQTLDCTEFGYSGCNVTTNYLDATVAFCTP